MSENLSSNKKSWLIIVGVIFGVLSILTSFIEPLANYSLTAFLLSIFSLSHELYSKIQESLKNTESHSSEMSKDVKNRLQVIRLDKPAKTFEEYIISRLHIISHIKNTSFNKSNNYREANEYFNEPLELIDAPKLISQYINSGLKWQDIGDDIAKKRFNAWHNQCDEATRSSIKGGYYKSSIINNQVPYPNFLIVVYKDGREEVLFNWDFRSQGVKPDVLVSNEKDLVHFYNSQFELLLDNATTDSDHL